MGTTSFPEDPSDHINHPDARYVMRPNKKSRNRRTCSCLCMCFPCERDYSVINGYLFELYVQGNLEDYYNDGISEKDIKNLHLNYLLALGIQYHDTIRRLIADIQS